MSHDPSSDNERPLAGTPLPPWGIGTLPPRGPRAWMGWPALPYTLDLQRQSGAVLGTSEASLSATLQRLAYTAARAGWKVWLFDAYGQDETAATFLASMQHAGHKRVRVFPHEPFDGWGGSPEALLHSLLAALPFQYPYAQHLAVSALSAVLRSKEPLWGMVDLVEQLCWLLDPPQGTGRGVRRTRAGAPLLHRLRRGDLPEVPLGYYALSVLLHGSLDGHWSFTNTDAAYFALRAWDRSQQARLHARVLLAILAATLVEQPTPTLLLIHHPERLLNPRQLASLFAQMQRARGSLWVATRSAESLGAEVLTQASTLLLHRQRTVAPLAACLSPDEQVWASRILPHLSEHECLALAEGTHALVRIASVPVDPAAVAQATRTLADRTREASAQWPGEPEEPKASASEEVALWPIPPDKAQDGGQSEAEASLSPAPSPASRPPARRGGRRLHPRREH